MRIVENSVCFRLLVCFAKRHSCPWAPVHNTELDLFLCQYLQMGDCGKSAGHHTHSHPLHFVKNYDKFIHVCIYYFFACCKIYKITVFLLSGNYKCFVFQIFKKKKKKKRKKKLFLLVLGPKQLLSVCNWSVLHLYS